MDLRNGISCITKNAGALSVIFGAANLLAARDDIAQMKGKVQLKNPKLEAKSLKLKSPYKYQFQGGKRFNSLTSNPVNKY